MRRIADPIADSIADPVGAVERRRRGPLADFWGGLLSREGRNYMQQAPWLAMWSGIFLTIVVYSFNMFGDAVRDLLDPRLRGGTGRFSGPRRQPRHRR